MSSVIPLLSNVQVAAPCSALWNEMEAVDGDRVHFCGGCKKNVYNLSAMTQTDAEGLLRKHEGHLCVRRTYPLMGSLDSVAVDNKR